MCGSKFFILHSSFFIKSTTFAAAKRANGVQWCNGSTTGFGSVCGGSNPPWTTDDAPQVLILWACGSFFQIFLVFHSFCTTFVA